MRLFVNTDKYGEAMNGSKTYAAVARALSIEGKVLLGWTDEHGTHLDIILVLGPSHGGANLQRGIKPDDLFIAIIERGAAGFNPDSIVNGTVNADYMASKLNIAPSQTSAALFELISGILLQYDNLKL